MQRISTVQIETAPDASKPVLEQINAKFGRVPNIFATLANSPAALKAMMGMMASLEEGALAGKAHEAIAVRIGQVNGCEYCTAAHTGKAKMSGASIEETIAWRKGESDDPKIKALLDLVLALNEKRGTISDEEIVEATAIVAANIFTNSINALVKTELDFPAAPPLE